MASTSWRELTTQQRATVVTLGAAQLALAITAWVDLARRPAEQIRGGKARWALTIALNFIGPILYFTKGRKKTS